MTRTGTRISRTWAFVGGFAAAAIAARSRLVGGTRMTATVVLVAGAWSSGVATGTAQASRITERAAMASSNCPASGLRLTVTPVAQTAQSAKYQATLANCSAGQVSSGVRLIETASGGGGPPQHDTWVLKLAPGRQARETFSVAPANLTSAAAVPAIAPTGQAVSIEPSEVSLQLTASVHGKALATTQQVVHFYNSLAPGLYLQNDQTNCPTSNQKLGVTYHCVVEIVNGARTLYATNVGYGTPSINSPGEETEPHPQKVASYEVRPVPFTIKYGDPFAPYDRPVRAIQVAIQAKYLDTKTGKYSEWQTGLYAASFGAPIPYTPANPNGPLPPAGPL